MDCPKCRLVNPPGALICDCGYNFATKQMGPRVPQTHKPEAPPEDVAKTLQWFMAVMFCLMLLRVLMNVEKAPVLIVVMLVYVAVLGALTWAVYKRSNAARITLIILTFPIGLFFLLKDNLRRHCTGG